MRCAFVSDIHANLQAWKSVLLDIRSSNVDKIICLGDIVGYGPNPAEVLESMYTNVDHFVLGNHDAVVCGKMDPALFNDSAQQIIAWTQKQLGPEAPKFLAALPLTLRAPSFRCAHATFSMPATFDYIIEPHDALASWRAVDDPLLFVGHTHQPGIYVVGQSGAPHRLDPIDFVIEAGKRYIVNVGSVGQPRDGETRACYCILDTDAASVTWRRVPFDLDAYRTALDASDIPPGSNHFLEADPTKDTPPLRELLQFSPVVTPSSELQKTPEVEELSALRRRVHRLRSLYVATVALVAAAAIGIGSVWWRQHTRALLIPGRDMAGTSAALAAIDAPLAEPFGVPSAPGESLSGWTVQLGNKRAQAVEVMQTADGLVLDMASRDDGDPICVRSAPVRVSKGMRIRMAADFRRLPEFRGDIELALVLTRDIDGVRDIDDSFFVKTPRPSAAEWENVRLTDEMPANAAAVWLEIRGQFRGSVQVRNVALQKRSDPK